ncbi:MAG: response regulator transcription factor [Bacteroidetes bacterium]|nr:response regulator transcription factor [Bacteroidota bacterium]
MTNKKNKIKILVVDDHQVLRKGLINLLHCNEDFQVVQEASNGLEALTLLEDYFIDIVLLDIEMPVMNGRETLINIKKKFPKVKVVMFSTHDEAGLINHFIGLGADAYLVKNSSFENICETITKVVNDSQNIKLNGTVKADISDQHLQLALTDIELKVLKLICANYNGEAISKNLDISQNTLKYYRKSIYSKTCTSSLSELIVYAIKQGIITVT